MRDRFSELIDAGVASFINSPVANEIPCQDDICRLYNNIYSIPSDTHMSCVDGRRFITGHMLSNQNKWTNFSMAYTWGGVDFRNTTGSVMKFLNDNGLKMQLTNLNGDVAYEVLPINNPTDGSGIPDMPNNITCPMCYTTTESQIPQPISLLVSDHNSLRIKECFESTKNPQDIAKKLNESVYIKGDNWTVFENKIIGTVNNSNCILKVYESNDEYIRYVIKLEEGPADANWFKILCIDNMFDKYPTGLFDKKSFKPLNSGSFDNDNIISILKKVNNNPVKVIKSLEPNKNYEIYGKDPYDAKMKIRPAKFKHWYSLTGVNF